MKVNGQMTESVDTTTCIPQGDTMSLLLVNLKLDEIIIK